MHGGKQMSADLLTSGAAGFQRGSNTALSATEEQIKGHDGSPCVTGTMASESEMRNPCQLYQRVID
jgi:hypothetical protein